MIIQRKTNFNGLTDGTFCLSTCFQIYRSVHAWMHVWLHQILAAHFANALQMHISYKYLFHTPNPILSNIPPQNITLILASGLWELPQNLDGTTTDAERHNQAAAAELSLPPLANTMQMSCAEHDPGCPEASTPVRCLVCQQENDCREKRFLTRTRPSLLSSARGIVGQEAEETRRWEKEQEGWEGKQGKREVWRGQNDFASFNKTISHNSTLKLEAIESIWAKRV